MGPKKLEWFQFNSNHPFQFDSNHRLEWASRPLFQFSIFYSNLFQSIPIEIWASLRKKGKTKMWPFGGSDDQEDALILSYSLLLLIYAYMTNRSRFKLNRQSILRPLSAPMHKILMERQEGAFYTFFRLDVATFDVLFTEFREIWCRSVESSPSEIMPGRTSLHQGHCLWCAAPTGVPPVLAAVQPPRVVMI